MTGGVRLAIHLAHRVGDSLFFKVASGSRHVTHVAKLKGETDLEALKPCIQEACAFSLG